MSYTTRKKTEEQTGLRVRDLEQLHAQVLKTHEHFVQLKQPAAVDRQLAARESDLFRKAQNTYNNLVGLGERGTQDRLVDREITAYIACARYVDDIGCTVDLFTIVYSPTRKVGA